MLRPSARALVGVVLCAGAAFASPAAQANDQGVLVDAGFRAFFGNDKVPTYYFPAAVHAGADYVTISSESGLMVGGRFDQFLMVEPGSHSFIARATVGRVQVKQDVDLRQVFTGFRHVNGVASESGALGHYGGPMVGYSQRYGAADLHVFWEVAATGYMYTQGGVGGRLALESRLRVAYVIGTIEWYLRVDPATGGELGFGLGGASAFEL